MRWYLQRTHGQPRLALVLCSRSPTVEQALRIFFGTDTARDVVCAQGYVRQSTYGWTCHNWDFRSQCGRVVYVRPAGCASVSALFLIMTMMRTRWVRSYSVAYKA